MKKALIIIGILAVAGGAFGYFCVYNKPHRNIAKTTPAYTLTATELTNAFSNDEAAANEKYLGKVLQVSGRIDQVVPGGEESIQIVLGTENPLATVSCNIDAHREEILKMDPQAGRSLTVKGECTGSLMGQVVLERCVVLSIE